MDQDVWEAEREQREKDSLAEHARLSKLFQENRFAFERERKAMIDAVISSAKDAAEKRRLRTMQDSWEKKMRHAGSEHNRFVLAQTLFWDHFYEVWEPAVSQFAESDLKS